MAGFSGAAGAAMAGDAAVVAGAGVVSEFVGAAGAAAAGSGVMALSAGFVSAAGGVGRLRRRRCATVPGADGAVAGGLRPGPPLPPGSGGYHTGATTTGAAWGAGATGLGAGAGAWAVGAAAAGVIVFAGAALATFVADLAGAGETGACGLSSCSFLVPRPHGRQPEPGNHPHGRKLNPHKRRPHKPRATTS